MTSTSEHTIYSRWEPRVGPQAAATYVRFARMKIFTGFLPLVVFGILCAGYYFQITALIVFGYLVIVLGLTLLVVRSRILAQCRREASEYWGFPVTARNFPPRDDARFATWRERHGLGAEPN